MAEIISNIKFKELIEDLSSGSIIKTKDGKLNIRGTILSSKDFDNLYLADIKDLFFKYETTISPEFSPSKEVYENLATFSNPILKSTGVPEITKSFQKKMSQAILDNYGKKFSGKEVIEFAENGYVEPEQVITMLKYKSLYAQDPKSEDYVEPVSYSELLDFYSPEKHPGRMLSLQKDNKLNLEFQEFHKEMLENISKKERKEYIEDLIHETKDNASTPQEFSENILEYANHQIIPDENLEQNISGEFLKKQYLDKKISIARIFAIYKTAPKYFSAVESILTPDEITKAHKSEQIQDEALMYIPKDSRIAYLQENNTKFNTMMYLFLHCNGFSIAELKALLNETHNTESLEFYIDEGSSPSKIKELYENYLIDYSCIKHLQSVGILTDKDIQKYNFSINKGKFYQELDNLQTVSIIGNGNSVSFSNTGFFMQEQKVQKVQKVQNLDVFKILGKENDKVFSELPTISHKDDKGKNSFLDNYKIIALKFSGLIAFVSNDNTKPTYIMPYQEAAYIIKNHRLPENFSENEQIKEVRNSEKTNEDILKTANTFEIAKPYLEQANYNEELDFASNFEIMLEQYQKIKIKGEN
jgi:hypothetical protein